jgi:hypothetical protein
LPGPLTLSTGRETADLDLTESRRFRSARRLN